MRILIVEDDPAVRESLIGFFSGKNHELTWVSSGRDALQMLHRTQFDFLILDLILDGSMTGWDVAYIKHGDPSLTWIPFVIMTGVRTADVHLGAHTHATSVQAAKCILQKPLDFKILDRVLRAVEAYEPVTLVNARALPAKEG